MSSKIVALVDASVYGRSVCEHAAWIAGRLSLPVELVHVLTRPAVESADLSGSIALGARTALLTELTRLDEERSKLAQKQGRALLEDARSIVAASGVSVSERLRHGEVVEAIADLEADAEMIIVGKRGEAADFNKLHLGSNLERLARASHKPLFVASRAFKPLQRFLIAFDGGTSSLKAVDHVVRSPLLTGLEARLLMAGSPSDELQRKLESAKAQLETAGFNVSAKVREGAPETVIAEAIEREAVDLLVMGAYGHSRIRTLLIGSTTTQMLRACKVPVLLFR